MDLTTTALISDLKLTGMLPDGMFSDDDYISFLNDGFFNSVLPFIMKRREEYFVTYTDYTYADTLSIPSNAVGQKLRDIVRVSPSGDFLANIPRLSYEEISGSNYTYHMPGFYIENNSIKFYPKGSISDTIRMYYYRRPNYLQYHTTTVDGATVYKNSLISSATGAVCTYDGIDSTWTTSTEIDVISHTQPYTVDTSYTIVDIDTGSSTITLSSTGFAEGDYICARGDTVYPEIPYECREILIQAAVLKGLISIKDVNGVQLCKEQLKDAEERAADILTPRVDGEVKKIVNVSGIWSNRRSSRNRGWW
jgi:hypothetical protein